jgi:hypothetical protein
VLFLEVLRCFNHSNLTHHTSTLRIQLAIGIEDLILDKGIQ